MPNLKKAHVNEKSAAPKRVKTGGRVVKPLAKKMEEARARAEISTWCDDTTLDTELAALYLCMSVKKLEELRSQSRRAGIEGSGSPSMIKIIDAKARGQNQPVQYKLGELRRYQAANTSASTFEAAVAAGLYG
jgi:hypothetical protein